MGMTVGVPLPAEEEVKERGDEAMEAQAGEHSGKALLLPPDSPSSSSCFKVMTTAERYSLTRRDYE